MGVVDDLLDRQSQLSSERAPWESHWLDVARYALPDVDLFDAMFASGRTGAMAAIDSMTSEPVAARRSRDIYDQTSLWAVERGTAGFMSLVTPQSEKWHGLKLSDPFGQEPSDTEALWLERVRDYLHNIRGNPATGFWTAHKAAMRCVWGLGTAVLYVDEAFGRGAAAPFSYRFVPLSESYLATNFEGLVDTNFRMFRRSARNCAEKWGDACSAKTKEMAADPKRKDQSVEVLHAVLPRQERGSLANSNRASDWASYYVETGEKHLIGDGGYFSFPFVVHHWNRSGQGPYSEGPMAIALAEVKSLNMLSKNALIAAQQAVNPPLATRDEGVTRINLNPRAVNPGLVNDDGRLLVQPILTAQRPDFANLVLESKRNQIKESLYVNLWQILIQNPDMTATEAMIRANEKGELLGPAGNSIQMGLSRQVDREVDIMERKGAFRAGSPLEPPPSMAGRDIGVRFSSPLDRLQRASEFVGMQRLVEFAGMLAQAGKPEVLERFDYDEMIDIAQEILNAPRRSLKSRDDANASREQNARMQQLMATIEMLKQGGEAGQSVAAGSDALAASPGVAGGMKGLMASAAA